jgi:hypothetical protein
LNLKLSSCTKTSVVFSEHELPQICCFKVFFRARILPAAEKAFLLIWMSSESPNEQNKQVYLEGSELGFLLLSLYVFSLY